MYIAIIAVLLMALITVIVLLIDQRRQVRDICRQLAFLKEQNSNLIVTAGVGSKSVQELASSINGMIEIWRENSDKLLKNKEVLQTTIMSLSHDIRTPLTSLTGYFQLLNECGSEEDRERYRRVIENRISSLKLILEELFTYAKLQDENYELEMTELNLSRLVPDTLFGFYEDFKAAKLEPEVEIEEGISIISNEDAIIRILQNLIKNALLHSLSEVRVAVTKVKVSDGVGKVSDGVGNVSAGKHLKSVERGGKDRLHAGTAYVQIVVANDTPKPEDIVIEKVFERFYKAESDRSKGSTGLGLSIVKGLSEKLGGNVAAELQGNIFRLIVRLPLV